MREAPKDEAAANAKLLVRAGFVDKLMAGVYSFLPLGLRVLKNIEAIVREEMDAIGGKELLMPALHPLENYVKTGREKIDVLFHTESSTGNKMVLGQSHEEVVAPLVKKFVSSWRDLPFAVYQIQTKFRNELRAKSGIFRGREFLMKDLYSFHLTEDDFARYYEEVKKAYMRVFKRVGIGETTYITRASGGTFSRYSDEFQTLTDAGEDTIHLCEKCRVAVNDEIWGEIKKCPSCGNGKVKTARSIEVGNIFPLKTRFAEAFDLKVKDERGRDTLLTMGCYGIGISRLMGAIAETHHDERGILWPETVAPFRVHLIEVKSQKTKVKREAERVYKFLTGKGIEVLYDDRDDKTAGEKFADADLIGIPWRVVISERSVAQNGVEIKERAKKAAHVIPAGELYKKIGRSV